MQELYVTAWSFEVSASVYNKVINVELEMTKVWLFISIHIFAFYVHESRANATDACGPSRAETQLIYTGLSAAQELIRNGEFPDSSSLLIWWESSKALENDGFRYKVFDKPRRFNEARSIIASSEETVLAYGLVWRANLVKYNKVKEKIVLKINLGMGEQSGIDAYVLVSDDQSEAADSFTALGCSENLLMTRE